MSEEAVTQSQHLTERKEKLSTKKVEAVSQPYQPPTGSKEKTGSKDILAAEKVEPPTGSKDKTGSKDILLAEKVAQSSQPPIGSKEKTGSKDILSAEKVSQSSQPPTRSKEKTGSKEKLSAEKVANRSEQGKTEEIEAGKTPTKPSAETGSVRSNKSDETDPYKHESPGGPLKSLKDASEKLVAFAEKQGGYDNQDLHYRFLFLTVNRCLFVCLIQAIEFLTIGVLQVIGQQYWHVGFTVTIHCLYMVTVAGIYGRNILIILFALMFYILNLVFNGSLIVQILDAINGRFDPETVVQLTGFTDMNLLYILLVCIITDCIINPMYLIISTVALVEALKIQTRKKENDRLFASRNQLNPDDIQDEIIYCLTVKKSAIVVIVLQVLIVIPIITFSIINWNYYSFFFHFVKAAFTIGCMMSAYFQFIPIVFVGLILEVLFLIFWMIQWAVLLMNAFDPNISASILIVHDIHPITQTGHTVRILYIILITCSVFLSMLTIFTLFGSSVEKARKIESIRKLSKEKA